MADGEWSNGTTQQDMESDLNCGVGRAGYPSQCIFQLSRTYVQVRARHTRKEDTLPGNTPLERPGSGMSQQISGARARSWDARLHGSDAIIPAFLNS